MLYLEVAFFYLILCENQPKALPSCEGPFGRAGVANKTQPRHFLPTASGKNLVFLDPL